MFSRISCVPVVTSFLVSFNAEYPRWLPPCFVNMVARLAPLEGSAEFVM